MIFIVKLPFRKQFLGVFGPIYLYQGKIKTKRLMDGILIFQSKDLRDMSIFFKHFYLSLQI